MSEAEQEVSGGGSHDLMTCDLTYISSLEDGVSEISKETEEKLKQQVALLGLIFQSMTLEDFYYSNVINEIPDLNSWDRPVLSL